MRASPRLLCISSISALAALLLLAAGCASSPPVPKDKLAVAEQAVRRAEDAGAAQVAGAELAMARDKLARANAQADKGSRRSAEEAGQLAEQATADARLAEARAEAAKADKAVTELEDSLRALTEEAARPRSRM